MTIPSKKEFQDLIDLCNTERLPDSIDIQLNKAQEHVRSILSEFIYKRAAALKEMQALPAYDWLNNKNGFLFPNAMDLVYPEKITDLDDWVERHTHSTTFRTIIAYDELCLLTGEVDGISGGHHCGRGKGFGIDGDTPWEELRSENYISFKRLKDCIENITQFEAKKLQHYERLIAKVARCFMDFIFPEPIKQFEPTAVIGKMSMLIKQLEKAKKLEDDFKKHNDMLYLSGSYDSDLQNKIDLYTAFLNDKKLLPAQKKISEKTPLRMFIVSITKALMSNMNPITFSGKKRTELMKEFTFQLVQIIIVNPDLGGLSMDQKNVRNIVSEEIRRQNEIVAIKKEIFQKD